MKPFFFRTDPEYRGMYQLLGINYRRRAEAMKRRNYARWARYVVL